MGKTGSSVAKLLGKMFVMVFIVCLFYAGYIFYIVKKLPAAKAEIAGIYQAVALSGGFQPSQQPKTAAPAVNGGWEKISSRTSDEKIQALDNKKIKNKNIQTQKVESYEKLLDSESLKVINQLIELVTGKKDSGILDAAQTAEMKQQIEQILSAYKEREEALKELE